MTNPHLPPASGKNCRSQSALFAASRSELIVGERPRRACRLAPLFAQFPPAALFMQLAELPPGVQSRRQPLAAHPLHLGDWRPPSKDRKDDSRPV